MFKITAADRFTTEATRAALLRSFGAYPWAFRHPDGRVFVLDKAGTKVLGPFESGTALSEYKLQPLARVLLANHLEMEDPKGSLLAESSKKAVECAAFVAGVLVNAPFLPTIDCIARTPAFELEAGQLRALQPGRHGLKLVTLDDSTALPSEIRTDYPHLRTIFSGLHWTDPRHYGNFMGWLVASFARSAVREFPPIVLNGTHKSVGKSTLAEAVRVLHGQEHTPSITYTGNEQEFENRLGAFANGSPGPTLIHIDNVRPKQGSAGEIRSQSLSAAATSWSMPARKLYAGPVSVPLPLVLFTMNGAKLENDLSDKVLTVTLTRLESTQAITALVPNPLEYARQHKYELLAEIYSILLSLKAAEPRQSRFFTFESLARPAAVALRLPHDYTPNAVESYDVFLVELVAVIESDSFDAVQLGPSYTDIAKEITSSRQDLTELPSFIRQLHQVTARAQGHYIRERVKDDYLGKVFPLNGRLIELVHTLDANHVTRVKTKDHELFD